MKKYRLPVTIQNTYIRGFDVLDAIRNNLAIVATIKGFDRATKERTETTRPHDEAWCKWSDDIIGGSGGVVVIMRGVSETGLPETNEAWVQVSKREWDKITQREGEETIKIR
jgi:hypothetical protein